MKESGIQREYRREKKARNTKREREREKREKGKQRQKNARYRKRDELIDFNGMSIHWGLSWEQRLENHLHYIYSLFFW